MAIQGMVTRTGWNGETWGANQKISLDEAIRVNTLNGAYNSHEEDIKGSITAGKLADYVVLADDLYSIPDRQDQGCQNRPHRRRRQDGLRRMMPGKSQPQRVLDLVVHRQLIAAGYGVARALLRAVSRLISTQIRSVHTNVNAARKSAHATIRCQLLRTDCG